MPHTPGPWKQWDRRDIDQGVLITDAPGVVGVCRVIGESQAPRKESKAICQANADLIAASPELLAELKGAIEALMYVELHFPAAHGYGVRKERIRSGLAAIAKAGTP